MLEVPQKSGNATYLTSREEVHFMLTPTPAPNPVSGDQLGTILSQSWTLLVSQGGQYALIVLAATVPVFILSLVFSLAMVGGALSVGVGGAGLSLGLLRAGLGFGVVIYAVSLVCGTLMIGALSHAASTQTSTGVVSFAASYRAAWAKFWVLLAVLIIVGLAVGLGSMLFVLPGFAALFFLCLSPIAIMVDGAGIGAAISVSFRRALKIPLEIFVIGVIACGATFILNLIPLVGWLASCVVVAWAFIALTLAYRRTPA
jgi:hypothetical protein